jgi:glycosyltransferase involved in cell wall biosynthesis
MTKKGGLAFGRYLKYPLIALAQRPRFDWFHIADHSYAHLALCLPPERTGVYCHDLDTFRPLFGDASAPRWLKGIAHCALLGMQRAAVVFHSTPSVKEELLERGLVPEGRLVAAPYGVSAEFVPEPGPYDNRAREPGPYVIHVGSLIERKNPELLLQIFASAKKVLPELRLLQVGASFDSEQRAFLRDRGLSDSVRQIEGFIQRSELAAYYRSALCLVLPSSAEGFGLPVIEALACGAPCVVSDIPVLRGVGKDAVEYCRLGEPEDWCRAILKVFRGEGPPLNRRLAVAAEYSWQNHAATILAASMAAFRRV